MERRSGADIVDVLMKRFLSNDHRVISRTIYFRTSDSVDEGCGSTICYLLPDFKFINTIPGKIVFKELPCMVICVFHILVVSHRASLGARIRAVGS